MSGSHLTSVHTLMRGARVGRVDGLGSEVGLASLRGLTAVCRQAPGGCLGVQTEANVQGPHTNALFASSLSLPKE